jgi:hypothetical protein
MKEVKKNSMGLRLLLFITLGLLLLPSVSSQDPPGNENKQCLHYAYTNSIEYNFLLLNNSKMFGNELRIIHNCEYLQVNIENNVYSVSNSSMFLSLNYGVQNLSIETNEYTRNYQIEVFPDRLQWETDFEFLNQYEKQSEFISIDLSDSRENWASIFSIIIVFVLTTFVYWKLIESYVNRNFIEEVVK